MNNHVLEELARWDPIFDQELFTGQESYQILRGRRPVCVSAPHSVSQWRHGARKRNEFRTGSMAIVLNRRTQCHAIYKTRNMKDDANYDARSTYKDALIDYVQSEGIKCLIDLHLMGSHHDHEVEIGTGKGTNIKGEAYMLETVFNAFARRGFSRIVVDGQFSATNPNTVSASVAQACGIGSLQIEINYGILRLPEMASSQLLVLQSLEDSVNALSES